MSIIPLTVLYGHLEGSDLKFARDPSGYLSREAGIYEKYRLSVAWEHVQGTEERYHRLENGTAQISFVVGRASLKHFLAWRAGRILGCAMNSCPYYLMVAPDLNGVRGLSGKTIACREEPSRAAGLEEAFQSFAQLSVGADVHLQSPTSDQQVFELLVGGAVQAALLPRPYAFLAEERGFKRIENWPSVIDDPLPITIETTADHLRARGDDLCRFLRAHSEGIRYLKSHRAETMQMLHQRFGHSAFLVAKTYDEYLPFLDEQLTVQFGHFARLLAQVNAEMVNNARQLAADWIAPGALTDGAEA